MGAIPIVKGIALRATKVDRCGKPLEGPANRIVTEGFIRANFDPNMKAREELEQTNAAGKVCFSDSTPPERKWYNTEIQLCGVDPDLYSMFVGYEKVLDYDDKAIGFRDSPDVISDYGVALEIWTGGRAEDDCDDPTDSIFSISGSGVTHGYILAGATEWQAGALTVEAAVGNFTLTGITMPMLHWGRGPYNVAAVDSSLTPGRLLVPTSKKEHLTFFRTPVPPPAPTNGACALAVQSIFTGGPSLAYFGAQAADVAPAQPICDGAEYTVVVGGTGNYKLLVGAEPTANIAHTALPAAVKSAVEALPNVEPGEVEVTGTAGNLNVVLDPSLPALSADSTGLTGGTAVVTAV